MHFGGVELTVVYSILVEIIAPSGLWCCFEHAMPVLQGHPTLCLAHRMPSLCTDCLLLQNLCDQALNRCLYAPNGLQPFTK